MAAEGMFFLQEEERNRFKCRPFSTRIIIVAALVISTIAGKLPAAPSHSSENLKTNSHKSIESENLFRQIEQQVKSLEYSDKVAEDFISMVAKWNNGRATDKLTTWRQKIHKSRQSHKHGLIKPADIAEIEKSIAAETSSMIKDHFSSNDDIFDMPDLIKTNQANCLGFTQLFYIIGNSIGLNVKPINVVVFQSTTPSPAGLGHIACIVELADNTSIMLNPVPGGFISRSFTMDKEFTKVGNYWQLNTKSNPLNLYRSIQVLDEDGLLAQIHNNRGRLYSTTGQLNQALTCYTRAIRLNPDYAEAYNNRAVAYRKSGQLKRALSDYTKAIELNPNYAEAYNNRGVAYRESGEFEQAIDDYNHAIKLNARFAEAFNNRAIVHLHMGQSSQAISDFSKAIRINRNCVEAYNNRAIAYSLSDQFKRAISDFNRAIKLNPDLAPLYYGRANAYGKLSKFDWAIADYTKAIELDPDFTKAHDNLQIAYALSEQSHTATQGN